MLFAMKFIQVFLVTLICELGRGANSNISSYDRAKRASNCGSLEFRCRNGDCIEGGLLCDGRADCDDRSDETRDECARPEIVCPEYAFRCEYGACVDGDAICNGIEDCVDKSDELLPECRIANGTGNVGKNEPKCPSGQFGCNDGRCIGNNAICDGATDCPDGSDETAALCAKINCPDFAFRCDYGACIDDALKCNGVRNCADGSDEDPRVCGTSNDVSNGASLPGPNRTRPPCAIPSQPENGRWRLHKSQCRSGQHCEPRGNTRELDPGTWLIYNCNEGYRVNGSGDVFCGPEGKWSNEPECVEINCKQLRSASTEADCRYNGEWISCDFPVPPRTVARVSCRNSYRQESTGLSAQRENVRCNARGQWQPEPIRCIPVCGQTLAKNYSKPLIVNGTLPRISDFPWHATLYKSETPDGRKQFICGATIVQSDLLITAAHCVYDEAIQRVEDANKFAVVTGNLFQEYNSSLHHPIAVKKAKVKRIYVICNYLGLRGRYARDIAIIQIEQPFTFSSILLPVCLDVSTYSDNYVLEVGNYGKVAGFGRTALANSSQVLQTISVPYVSLSECRSSSSNLANDEFITIDKFCAGYRNGSSVCDGDSGGGLVFQTGGLWYLRGIVSVGLGATFSGGTRSCDSYAYSLYTRISSHIEWIQDVILKLETQDTFPSCPEIPRNRRNFD